MLKKLVLTSALLTASLVLPQPQTSSARQTSSQEAFPGQKLAIPVDTRSIARIDQALLIDDGYARLPAEALEKHPDIPSAQPGTARASARCHCPFDCADPPRRKGGQETNARDLTRGHFYL